MRIVSNNSLGLDVSYIKLDKAYTLADDRPIRSPEDAVEAVSEVLKDLDREVVCCVALKTDGTPINMSFVSMGTLNTATVCPREVMKTAVLSNAAGIMLFHNHPSGGALPSSQDIEITDRLNQACQLMGIDLVDHIIIGAASKEWFSFKTKAMINPVIPNHKKELEEIELSKKSVRRESKTEKEAKEEAADKAAEQKNIYRRKHSR